MTQIETTLRQLRLSGLAQTLPVRLEVIMRRYENRSTIMTSNRPLEDWGKLLSDVPTAGAILDRFLHHAITITISGRSYRVKDSLPPPPENKPRRKSHEPATAGGAS